jgi:hypothetical protein
LTIDLVQSACCCGVRSCRRSVGNAEERLVGRFIGDGEPKEGQVVVAAIDLRGLTYDGYISVVKRRYKGNVVRDARKSDKAGFICRPFERSMHVPDIVAANQSKEERQGKPMKEAYLKSVDEAGGEPKKKVTLQPPECPCHYDLWWGIFKPEPGFKQGHVVTDERLIAYIDFRRIGSLGIYSLILGHGAFLQYGVMYRLHFAVMEHLLERSDETTRGLEMLMYAGFYQGSDGLQLWKKKTAFEPCYFVRPREPSSARIAEGGGLLGRITGRVQGLMGLGER